MNLRSIIQGWFSRRRRIRMQQEVAALERRRAAIRDHIAARRETRKEWRPLVGSLKDTTTAALRAENQLAGM